MRGCKRTARKGARSLWLCKREKTLSITKPKSASRMISSVVDFVSGRLYGSATETGKSINRTLTECTVSWVLEKSIWRCLRTSSGNVAIQG